VSRAPRTYSCAAAEVESATLVLNTPAARLIAGGGERLLLLEDVEALVASEAFVADACRHVVRQGRRVDLARNTSRIVRARTSAGRSMAWGCAEELLLARAFGVRLADESHRARLRVEVGRLRRALRRTADITATKRGFPLAPRRARELVVLAQPVEMSMRQCALSLPTVNPGLASSALALALGTSQRTVQRALDSLAAAGKVQSFGRKRARRWLTPPVPGFTTTLLLPAPLPID
jgi:hypothetical protein